MNPYQQWSRTPYNSWADAVGSANVRKTLGAASGLQDHWDICPFPAVPGCATGSTDNSSGQCGQFPVGCTCRLGEGHCDRKSDCRVDLVCGRDLGAHFGRPSAVYVCVMPGLPGVSEIRSNE